jgi:hypothetical protein
VELSSLLSIIAFQLSLDGIPKNPGEQDDYIRNKGPIPQFNSEYGCIQDVIQFKTNDKALGMNIKFCCETSRTLHIFRTK